MEKIEISTVAVRIRVIEVGGKKMTISVFNQIQDGFFFDDEVADEDRSKGFLGWVLHKGCRYILFYRDGGLFTDRFDPERPNAALKLGLSLASDRYKATIRSGYGPDSIQMAKNELSEAQEKFDSEVKRCDAFNKLYLDLFTNETQIYIAV